MLSLLLHRVVKDPQAASAVSFCFLPHDFLFGLQKFILDVTDGKCESQWIRKDVLHVCVFRFEV